MTATSVADFDNFFELFSYPNPICLVQAGSKVLIKDIEQGTLLSHLNTKIGEVCHYEHDKHNEGKPGYWYIKVEGKGYSIHLKNLEYYPAENEDIHLAFLEPDYERGSRWRQASEDGFYLMRGGYMVGSGDRTLILFGNPYKKSFNMAHFYRILPSMGVNREWVEAEIEKCAASAGD